MTKPWITSPRDRRSMKYLVRHAQLRAEVEGKTLGQWLIDEALKQPSETVVEVLDKRERKRGRSQEFRARGE